MQTFSATIALVDDDGDTHDTATVLARIILLANDHAATIFSTAHGYGIDTDTDQEEPIVIVQGVLPQDDADEFERDLLEYAGRALNQRAIGWFTSDDSYCEVW